MATGKQNMKPIFKNSVLSLLAAAVLGACGGGGGDNAFQAPVPPSTTPAAPVVAAVTATASSPTLQSDGGVPVEIRAYVRNASNQYMADVPVTFSANSGGLTVTRGITDASGLATATLTPAGDPTRRAITVTVQASTASTTLQVEVVGSSLSLQGATALNLQQQATYTVRLADAAGTGIAGRTLQVSSQRGNTLSAASLTTDSTGAASFSLTAVQPQNDTVTVTGLGLTATRAITVNADKLEFLTPVTATEVALGATQAIRIRRTSAGVALAGQTVVFSTTRGSITPASAVTDAAGEATASVTSANAGGAVVTAATGAVESTLPIEFVAATPATAELQPDVFTIGPNQSATLTAVVRDAAGNLVKNQTVVFTLADVTGGTLSVGSAVTDSQGRAQTAYRSSSTTSASGGVRITATVSGTAISDVVDLTVARREVFLSLGTGNTISEPNSAQYLVEYAVQVTDANGSGVAGVPVSMRMLSTRYYKGTRTAPSTAGGSWSTSYSVVGGCADEDVNRNGTLDAGEDTNGNGRVDAGNVVTVSPASVVTDASGFALVNVTYPQEHAYYLDVELSANATVQGSEYVRSARFLVPGSAADFKDANVSPPGIVSPFGKAASCLDPN